MKQSCPEESSSTMLTLPDTGRVLTFSVDIDHLPLELQSTTNLKTGLSTTGMNLSTTSGMGILKVNWMNKIVNGKQKQSFNDRIKVDIHNQELVKDHELLLVHSGMSLFRCWGRRTGQVTCEYWHWVTTSFCFSYHQMWQSEQLICSWINSSSFVQWQHGAHCSFPSFVNIHLHPYLLMKERKPSPSKQRK